MYYTVFLFIMYNTVLCIWQPCGADQWVGILPRSRAKTRVISFSCGGMLCVLFADLLWQVVWNI